MTSLAEGQTFAGRYRLLRKIGEGGFAEVYLAEESTGERTVAIKVLTPDGRTRETYAPQTKSRFDREVQILGKLRDPHTVAADDQRAPKPRSCAPSRRVVVERRLNRARETVRSEVLNSQMVKKCTDYG